MFKRRISVLLIICLCFSLSLSFAYGENPEADYEVDNDQHDIKIPILTYHHFVEGNPPKGTEASIISIELFEQQLKYLRKNGFHAISLSQLKDYLIDGTELPPNPFVITIDDGYKSNYTLAYPVLQELNMPANINIIVFSRGLSPGIYPHFSWKEARKMQDSGLIEFGSHTYNLHNKFIQIQPEEDPLFYNNRIYNDFRLSRNLMREYLEIEPYIYCSPYGIYNDVTQSAIKDLGFQLHLTTRSGVVTKESDPLSLERINVSGNYTPEDLLEKILYYSNNSGIEEIEDNSINIPFLPLSHSIINPLQYIDAMLKEFL